MPYRLEDLGPHEFERLVQTLLLRVYGPTVQVFGSGRDDGRDAAYTGRAVPADQSRDLAPVWDGYHVFQAKFHERPTTTGADRIWLRTQTRSELRRWTETVKNGDESTSEPKRKGQRPDYYVLVTNVALSGQIGGGHNDIEQEIRDHAAANGWPLTDCQVWDRSKIERLLDAFADVRQAFNGLITPGDVLAALAAGTMTVPTISLGDALPLLEEHARTEILSGHQVSTGEAGQKNPQRIDLTEIAVDLPVHDDNDLDPTSSEPVLRRIVTTSNRVLRPSVREKASPHILLMGGPGHGKTTLGKILVQIYRANLVAARPNLSEDVRDAVSKAQTMARGLGLPRLSVARWPFRVDLAEYADVAGGGADVPLVQYIADEINKVTAGEFRGKDTRQWLTAWPWLLVLDGYDEVSAVHARTVVAKAVRALLEAAQTLDADLMVVATTRPHGYGDELPLALRKLSLINLSPGEARRYATLLTELRMGDDPEKPAVLQRVADAVEDDLTGRLMRTPLQVMIMSLLLDARRKPPQDRADLFGSYYDIVYDREVNKERNYLANILRDYRADVDAIHNTAGLHLQVASEDGVSDALMSAGDLESIVRDRLRSQEHEGADLDRLTAELGRAAKDRLVLLTAQGKDQVGFELRSIQEFMAARALTGGPDDEVLRRLSVVARSAHWRNTWLLSVGLVYRSRQDLFERLLSGLRALDHDDPLSLLVQVGPRLAVDILEDGVAVNSPKYVRLLTDHALESLTDVNLGSARLGAVLADLPDAYSSTRERAIAALERALRGSPDEHRSARAAIAVLARGDYTGPLSTRARQLQSSIVRLPQPRGARQAGQRVRLSDALDGLADGWQQDSPSGRFLQDLKMYRVTTDDDGAFGAEEGLTWLPSARDVLTDAESLSRVVEAVGSIESYNWSARASITALLWIASQRIPVSDDL